MKKYNFLYGIVIIIICILINELYGDTYQQSWKAGQKDINNKRMNGTEIVKITAHKGKLFAATSIWMESEHTLGGSQILIKESHKSPWKVEHQFGPDIRRCLSLFSLTFTTDYEGKKIKPITILLAGTSTKKNDMINIYRHKDKSGGWMALPIVKAKDSSQIRGIGFHRDKVTGIDMVFVGIGSTKNKPASYGLITGAYKDDAKGRIVWNKKPELKLGEKERFMEFSVCNGDLYVSSTKKIFKRIDGEKPKWTMIFEDSRQFAPLGIRGLATVPKPGANKEELLFINWAEILRLDPLDNNKITKELDIPAFLTEQWKLPVKNALAGYNKIVSFKRVSGETCWLVGFQSTYDKKWIKKEKPKDLLIKIRDDGTRPVAYFAGEGRFLVRSMEREKINYDIKTIDDPSRSLLGAVRTLAPSPFKEDKGDILYLGGIDCNGIPHHDTGWIYRVKLKK